MTVKIREAKEEEIEEIAEICRDEIYDELPLEWVMDWLKSYKYPYLQFFVAEKDGRLVGFSGWSLYDRYGSQLMWELSFIAVKDDYKRKGIGRKLIWEALEEVRRNWQVKGLRSVMMVTETEEENEVACKFYDSVLNPCQKEFIPEVWEKEGGKFFYFKSLR
jgi:ribosomal protein S18 acetylase RimI-like enzyme